MTDNGKAQEVVKHIQAALTEMWEAEKIADEIGVRMCRALRLSGAGKESHIQIFKGIDKFADALGKETYNEPWSDGVNCSRRVDYKGVRFEQLADAERGKDGKVSFIWR